MKSTGILAISLLLFGAVANAEPPSREGQVLPNATAAEGERGGNGGNEYLLMFQSYANRVAKILRTEGTGKLAEVNVNQFVDMASRVVLLPKPVVLLDGTEVDAKNYLSPPTIELNTTRWDRADDDLRMAILFHEVGNLIGIDFKNYPYSQWFLTLLKEHHRSAANYRVKQLALGSKHSCALLENGDVQCWGNPGNGLLGAGEDIETFRYEKILDDQGNPVLDEDKKPKYRQIPNVRLPVHVVGLREEVQSITPVAGATCALLKSGKIVCWGEMSFDLWKLQEEASMLESRFEEFNVTTPRYVYGISPRRKMGEIDEVRTEDALSFFNFKDEDPKVRDLLDPAVSIQGSQGFNLFAATVQGKLFWFPIQYFGNFHPETKQPTGAGKKLDLSYIPEKVIGVAHSFSNHVCFLTQQGHVWCQGNLGDTEATASLGQLGMSASDAYERQAKTAREHGWSEEDIRFGAFDRIPVQVPGIEGAVQLASVWQTLCALLKTGEVKCWGANTFGQRGNFHIKAYGADGNEPNYVLVDHGLFSKTRLTDVKQISGGGNRFCAVTHGGKVFCWGSDEGFSCGVPYEKGEIADYGFNNNVRIPLYGVSHAVEVEHLRGKAEEVATGENHSCAILEDRKVQCWGDNEFGQLGDGTTVPSYIPISVQGLGW